MKSFPVLVIFTGSDWSALSITFEQEILTHQVFEKWAETKVVWTIVDLPQIGLDDEELRKRRELMKKLGVETFPMAVFLNPKEEPLGTLTHDPKGPDSWTKRADAILAGKTEASDTAASTEYLPEEIRKSLEDETLTKVQRSVAYYNKALELEKAEPEISLKSKDRFKLLIDLYSKAGDAAPRDRKDLIFAAPPQTGTTPPSQRAIPRPQVEQEIIMMSRQERSNPVKLLKMAKRSFETALGIYKDAAPSNPAMRNSATTSPSFTATSPRPGLPRLFQSLSVGNREHHNDSQSGETLSQESRTGRQHQPRSQPQGHRSHL